MSAQKLATCILKMIPDTVRQRVNVCEFAGMTQNEQEGVIEKFRAGDVKLLVCTTVGQEGMDIPDCNLVIRYNHVGNEVTTVQTRGEFRGRQPGQVHLVQPRCRNQT